MEDMDWIGLLILLFANPDIRNNMQKDLAEQKRLNFLQENCQSIEWWQDMNAHIPFCRLTGKPCGMECVERASNILIENPEICKCVEEDLNGN